MKIKVGALRQIIKEVLSEIGGPRGKIRGSAGGGGGGSGRKVKLGKIEDENRELSAFDANTTYRGSVDAWCEVAQDLAPETFSGKSEREVRTGSSFFSVGGQLRVADKFNPQDEIAYWAPEKGEDGDWISLHGEMDLEPEDRLPGEKGFGKLY